MSVLLLVLTALVIAMNGFFVAAEYALVRSRRNKVEAMESEGDSGAGRLRRQIDDIDEYIATCQVGITMASIGLGALGEPTIANLLEGPLGVDPDRAGEETSSSEDLKFLIARSSVGGTLDPGEADMLQGVFHLHEQEVRQVMTPIPAVVTIDISATAEEAVRRCVDSGHT